MTDDEDFTFYKGQGCADCFYTGYRGRLAVFEILTINTEMRRAIQQNDMTALEIAIENSEFKPILENCKELVLEGITTAREVSRAVSRTDY